MSRWDTETMSQPSQKTTEHDGRASREEFVQAQRCRSRWWLTVLVGCVLAMPLCLSSTSSAAPRGWIDTSLRVVGTPAAAGDTVVMLTVSHAQQLELTAVEATDGKVKWQRPFSPSEVTPGVGFGPAVSAGVALELLPAGGATDPAIYLEGVDVSTGRVLWHYPDSVVLSDAPTACGNGRYFCIDAFSSATATYLVLLRPTTGSLAAFLAGPSRNLGTYGGGLYESDSSAPSLEQVTAEGKRAWTATVASLFGSSRYNPNYGWNFTTIGAVDLGSVSPAPQGDALNLSLFRTVQFAVSDGRVLWRAAGDFDCGGPLDFLTVPVLCRFSGTVHRTSGPINMAGVKLSIDGFSVRTGSVTWSRRVLGVEALIVGTNVPFEDGSHVVVQPASGKRVILDVTDGRIAPVRSGDVFWCEQNPEYHVKTAAGAVRERRAAKRPRVSTLLWYGHSRNGPAISSARLGRSVRCRAVHLADASRTASGAASELRPAARV